MEGFGTEKLIGGLPSESRGSRWMKLWIDSGSKEGWMDCKRKEMSEGWRMGWTEGKRNGPRDERRYALKNGVICCFAIWGFIIISSGKNGTDGRVYCNKNIHNERERERERQRGIETETGRETHRETHRDRRHY